MPDITIVLTGFMATGKSLVGRLVAERSGRRFVDTDTVIVERVGKPISAIFEEEGEAAFRAMEAAVARELAGQPGLVIASGGRLMLNPLNALLLGRNALVFCLTAAPEEILSRLEGDTVRRPLLEVADPLGQIQRLLAQRAGAYGQFQQVSTSSKTAEQVAAELLDLTRSLSVATPPAPTSRIPVRHPQGSYQVLAGYGLLASPATFEGLPGAAMIITDNHVGPYHAARLDHLSRAAICTLPAGEAHKNLDTVRGLYDRFLEAGLDRKGTVIALGGGVVGDMAGFAAATYMRGVPFVQCPTTVLAMVDASVGGKTGVDLPQGKNLVGAFKQPERVIADLDTLITLPTADFTAGLAEVIKHGLIAGPALLASLETAAWALPDQGASPQTGGDARAYSADLQALIVEAILIKRDVVEADPFESGRRRILNLGHTFAHAIEQVSSYHITHGRAVAIGLAAAARLSALLGACPPDLPKRVETLLSHVGLPNRLPPGLPERALTSAMGSDKKKWAGRIHFILLEDAGRVMVSDRVPEAAVLAAWRQVGAEK